MPEATQFCISLKNEPGVLAKLCATLGRAEVNVDALFVSDDEDCCWVNLVVTPSDAARRTLTEEGYNFFTEKVLVLQIDDQPGSLERISSQLAQADININYVYGSSAQKACTLVLGVSDLERAAKVLGA